MILLNDKRSFCGKAGFRMELEVAVGADPLQGRGDGRIVGRGGGESFLRQAPLGGRGKFSAGFRHLFGDRVVVGGRSDDRHILKILGGGADHRRPADVDVLDQFFERHAWFGSGFLKGIKIHHHHVDRLNAVLGDSAAVRGILAAVQNASVHLGMQRLDAAVEHLGKAGELGDIFDLDAGVAQQFGGAAGGDQFHAQAGELAGEFHQSGFVGHAENGTLNLRLGRGHGRPRMEWECVRQEILSVAVVGRQASRSVRRQTLRQASGKTRLQLGAIAVALVECQATSSVTLKRTAEHDEST